VNVPGVNAFVTNTPTVNQGGAPWSVVGNVVSGSADSGNPVKIGGVFNQNFVNPLGPISLSNGQRGDLQLDSLGRLIVVVANQPSLPALLYRSTLSGSIIPGQIFATFGRPVTSTADALDVNVKYPPAASDPCLTSTKTNLPISVTANTQLLSGLPKQIRICSIFLVSSSAETFSIVEGLGPICATGILAVVGGTTAANGPSFSANGIYTQGSGGAWVASQQTPGNNLCILISGATLVAGNLTYAY
jgi:hypothetical protein